MIEDFDLISIQLFKDITSSSALNSFDENKFHTSDLIKAIKIASKPINFFCRHPEQILQKLVDDELIDYKTYCKWKHLFHKYGTYVDEKKINKIKCPKGYFRIKGHGNYYFHSLFEDIHNQCNGEISPKEDEVFVPLKSIERFLSLYHNNKIIDWSDLSSQTNIPWTTDLITKYNDVWDWRNLERNPSVDFNFDLVERNANEINWNLFPDYSFNRLKWTASEISKLSKYIVREASNFSYSLNVEKKKDVLDEFIDIWDWDSLSANINIQWDLPLITHFESRLNFICLSANESIQWNVELIEKYENKWDWALLSDNLGLPWSLEFIEKFENKWNWKFLSGNKKLPWSKSFISLYEEKWTWESLKDSVYKYFDKRRFNNEHPSLSTNCGITWNEGMLSRWKNKLDLFYMIKYGIIDDLEFCRFQHKFDERRVTGSRLGKYSDSYANVDTYTTGWENLNQNDKFYISKLNVEFFYTHKCELQISNGGLNTFFGEGTYNFENPRTLEVIRKCKVKDFKITDLISNELRWTKILLNERFINDSIWTEIIRPFFTKRFTLKYLERLSDIDSKLPTQ